MNESLTSFSHKAAGAQPAALVLDRFPFPGTVYSEHALSLIDQHFRVIRSGIDGEALLQDPASFAETEVIFGTWGLPTLSPELLRELPQLRAVFHAAGAWEALLTDEAREREILLCNSIDLNSDYVARQCISTINLALKGFFSTREAMRRGVPWDKAAALAEGIYQSTVGLVGLGHIGKNVAQSLAANGIKVLAFDPLLQSGAITEPAVTSVSIQEIFANCSVVSLHLPGIPKTKKVIDRRLLQSLSPHACLINTARGSVIDESALIEILTARTDLIAILDVCQDEPVKFDHALLQLSNCYLTPHISGAIGREREHLGDCMAEEALRWLRGEPLRYAISGVTAQELV